VIAAVVLLLAVGLFFSGVASLGVLRLPDFFARLHAVGKAETLGVLSTLAGLALWQGLELTSLKVLLVALFFFLTNPTATHAISRAALRTGQRPLAEVLPHDR
jgi:multicomponent Na+:H+ antiporter subunit G